MHLDSFADHLGCEVRTEFPHSGRLGEYVAASHMIRLHPDLIGAQRQAVLSHELGHAIHRHASSTPRTEREADHAAHWLTVGLCGFLRAVQAHESMRAVAHELGVLPADVRSYAARF